MNQNFSNPNLSPTPKVATKQASRGIFKLETWIWVILMATAILGLYWFARQQGGPSNRYLALLLPQVSDERLFVPQQGLSQAQARDLYRSSYQALQAKNYDVALSGFEKLEPAYPGLRDLILLHQAQAAAQKGNEWTAQQALQAIPVQKPESALRAAAQYELALSHFRAQEVDKAKAAFESVRKEHPNSPYAIGSLYYLGSLAKSAGDTQTAQQLWRDYLVKCPDCRFSGDIADNLPALLPQPSPTDHLLMGVGLASNQRNWDQALAHLKQAPPEQAWLWLAKTQLEKGQTTAAVQTLKTGLAHAKNSTQAQEAIDQILKHDPREAKTVLLELNQSSLAHGRDYVLWRLGQLTNETPYYQGVLSQNPKSDYAPESSWQLIWSDYKAGRRDAFLQRAQSHLSNYPYSRSAPRVLFWLGKALESGNPNESRATYQKLVKTYPNDYYAFRAAGRLAVLQGQSDPGWKTMASRAYPPNQGTLSTLNTLKIFPSVLPKGLRRDALSELQQMGMGEDVTLLFTESGEKVPAAVESWAYQIQGERAKGVRAMREGLETRQREAFEAQTFTGAVPTEAELRLLYPVYFGEEIAAQAKRQGIDPFLVQSLMREESYFNEFAVSGSDARGLMQLLPTTAKEVAGWENLSGFQTLDLFRPDVNVRLGSRYLGHLHSLFNGHSMPSVGAYNGGPNAMKRWINSSSTYASDPDRFVEDIPYGQSRDYIKKVFGSFWNYHQLYGNG